MPIIENIIEEFKIIEFRGLAIDSYILSKPVKRKIAEKEFVFGYYKIRSDETLTNKFATLMVIKGYPILILHVGEKSAGKGLEKQKEINARLGQSYDRSELQINKKAHEVFIRLDWVKNLEDIKEFIDEAYEKRD